MLFLPRRELGRTGFKAAMIGIGDLADRNVPLKGCVATVRRAMDAGCNVIDTAPMYEDGYSEEIVGAAVKADRDRMFVIDKVDHFDRPVIPQVEASLKRMKLDMADAFVFHACSKKRDWRRLAAPGGGMDDLAACIRKGMIRFRGISSHSPDVLIEAINSGLCDIVMFAAGPNAHPRFISEVLPLAKKKGVGTVCFKAFGAGKLVCDTAGYGRPLAQRPRGKLSSGGSADGPRLPHLDPAECVQYLLTCDPDVSLLGLSFPNEQDPAFEAARTFKPLTKAAMQAIRNRGRAALRGKGPSWWNPR